MQLFCSSNSVLLQCTLLWCITTLTWAEAVSPRPGGLPDGIDSGELKVLQLGDAPPEKTLQLPLRHTEVNIAVSGFVARTTVIQQYSNPFAQPIEAVYVFPLPHQAAVDSMNLRVGNKVILGLIKQRDEARQLYEQAKHAGQRAGLLEQERSNIFTQSVSNILPGDDIRVEITYVDLLDYRDEGAFELVFPLVVGPRYIPGQAIKPIAGGRVPDTDQVPDAARITPPVLKAGERSGHDVQLRVDLEAGLKIQGIHSPSHAVDIRNSSDTRQTITLHPADTLPNKDFILRYTVAGAVPEVTVIAHHTPEKGGYFTLIGLPQQQVDDQATVARDLLFILDTSGSMHGFPLDKSKAAIYRLLDGMRASDRFNVIRFAGDSGTLWPEPRPKTAETLKIARQFINSLQGEGGTEMRGGINAALSQPADSKRLCIALLLTDGYVGNEEAILKSIEQERRGARVFTLGIGSSVNRFLLDQAAIIGRGESFYLRQDENAEAVIGRFFKRVDRPNLAHIEIDWNGLDVSDLTPAQIPDLWQGQPILIHGRYRQGGTAEIHVRGVLGGQTRSWPIKIKLPQNEPNNAVLASVWARAKITALSQEMLRTADRERRIADITALGLEYHLMTPWTAFVALEEKVVNSGGTLQTVQQPLELPEGVDREGALGREVAIAPAAPAPIMRAFKQQAPSMKMETADQTTSSLSVQPASGLLNKQMLAESAKGGTINAPPAALEPPQENAPHRGGPLSLPAVNKHTCQYSALSVSGGLKYAAAEPVLRLAWPDLCKRLEKLPDHAFTIQVQLNLGADGKVVQVVLIPNTLEAKATEILRTTFSRLVFPVLADGAQLTLQLEWR